MLSNNRTVQQAELAGKTKLTAVTIGHGNHRKQFFVMLEHDDQGRARLPLAELDKQLKYVPRWTTITIG
jgi:hypothetical protein